MTIGQPLSRLEGAEKTTGRAKYAGDVAADRLAHAVIVGAQVPTGRVAALATARAEAAPGVVGVLSHLNAPRLRPLATPPLGQTEGMLQSDRVFYEGQPVALVLADTLERATEAARLVSLTYAGGPFETDYRRRLDKAESRPIFAWPADAQIGDVDRAFADAPVRVEAAFETADRHHVTMEPSATLASWRDGELLMEDAVQGVVHARDAIAALFGLDAAKVRVRNAFVGGGFGCKGWVWPHQVLAAMAARVFARPVRLTLTRAQTFVGHGYQPATRQTVALAARRDGTLLGMRHDTISVGAFAGEHVEGAGVGTRSLYACPSVRTTHRLVRVDRGNPTPMRAPLEGVGLFAVEVAMDELAYELGMDPLALRLKNYAEVDLAEGKPFSSKKLRECYAEGARRFGWDRRDPRPRSHRDGRDLVGWGMATALFASFRQPAKARLTLEASGRFLLETGTQEIGTGARTIFPQIAAAELGVPVDRVEMRWADTTLPNAPMQAGSASTGSVGSAVQDAARKLRAELGVANPPDYAAALARRGAPRLAVEGSFAPPADSPASLYSFGAVFAEVRVDADIPIPRVSRIVGVYDAGRIINPKTARSQMTGGLIWGIGQALLEDSAMDHRNGRFLSKNLAGYLIPVNADTPQLDVAFIDAPDTVATPIGARGIGELGAIGVGAAIANAVHHATGVRVRSAPIRPEMLLT